MSHWFKKCEMYRLTWLGEYIFDMYKFIFYLHVLCFLHAQFRFHIFLLIFIVCVLYLYYLNACVVVVFAVFVFVVQFLSGAVFACLLFNFACLPNARPSMSRLHL